MDDSFNLAMHSASPEHFLELLRDQHRQACGFDPETDPAAQLSFSMTVAQWRDALDLLPCRQLPDSFNEMWGNECSREEWLAALLPEKQRTLADVCGLLARHVKLPGIQPAGVLGASCLPAGVFVTVRSLLRDAGADSIQIAPSTPLSDFAQRHMETFVGPISWLAPGGLPQVRIYQSSYGMAVWGIIGMVAGALLMGLGYFVAWPWVPVFGGLITFIYYCMTWIAAIYPVPHRVEFGELKTFRDLSISIARVLTETNTNAKQSQDC